MYPKLGHATLPTIYIANLTKQNLITSRLKSWFWTSINSSEMDEIGGKWNLGSHTGAVKGGGYNIAPPMKSFIYPKKRELNL